MTGERRLSEEFAFSSFGVFFLVSSYIFARFLNTFGAHLIPYQTIFPKQNDKRVLARLETHTEANDEKYGPMQNGLDKSTTFFKINKLKNKYMKTKQTRDDQTLGNHPQLL